MTGVEAGDRAGYSVAGAGDVNGDGLADMIVGASFANYDGISRVGDAYVVFGRTSTTPVPLSQALAGTVGFAFHGVIPFGFAGTRVDGGGDVNGDGKDDVIIAAYLADLPDKNGAGQSYLVFGKTSGSTVYAPYIQSGSGGFAINGAAAGDNSGQDVAIAGDVNGDGKADLIVGANSAEVGAITDAGRAYVVFGKASGSQVELSSIASGAGGFVINGIAQQDYAGYSVSGGDVNGDGKADLIVSAPRRDPGGRTDAGAVYVVFGKTSTTAVNLSSVEAGTGGFVINGIDALDQAGYAVENAGDVNGDGREDIVIGAHYAEGQTGTSSVGEAYVVFGKTSTTAINLSSVANGAGGFIIHGIDEQDQMGYSVSGVGDVDGDGLDDIIVGARSAEGATGGNFTGESYVVFGKTNTSAVQATEIVAGSGGFVIYGSNAGDGSGHSVNGAGDVNVDGLDDLFVGAPFASPNGATSGEAYLIHGRPTTELRVGILDAQTASPITTATLFVQRTDAALGFQGAFSGLEGGDAVYETRLADSSDYIVRASAPGYLPTEALIVRPDLSSSPATFLSMNPDNNLLGTNTVRVRIVVLDENLQPTSARLLTGTAILRDTGVDIGLDPLFGEGEMIFLGVPSGALQVFVPNTANFSFTSQNITLGTGVTVDAQLNATITNPVPFRPAFSAQFNGPRVDLPGQIVGSVANTGPVTPGPLADALVLASNTSTGISIFARSVAGGTFVFPDVLAGPGEVRAFSPDGAIAGTIKPVDIVAGQVYGDQPATEDTAMEVALPNAGTGDTTNDSDFDGLPNSFENTYFDGSVPTNQRGPDDDPDGDGLTNFEEYVAGTDPTEVDSDGDGVEDGVELVLGANPTNASSVPVPPDPVWVDFGYGGALEVGTADKPYSDIQTAISAAPSSGALRIKGDVADVIGAPPQSAIAKPLTLEAFRGTIRIE